MMRGPEEKDDTTVSISLPAYTSQNQSLFLDFISKWTSLMQIHENMPSDKEVKNWKNDNIASVRIKLCKFRDFFLITQQEKLIIPTKIEKKRKRAISLHLGKFLSWQEIDLLDSSSTFHSVCQVTTGWNTCSVSQDSISWQMTVRLLTSCCWLTEE